MKKLVCGTAVAMTLALAFPGPTEAQSPPPPIQPGGPPAQTQAAPPPSPYTVPRTTTVVKKTTVRRRRGSSDNIANQINAMVIGGTGSGVVLVHYCGIVH